MSTLFPGAIQPFTNPTSSDDLGDAVGGATHSAQHANLNDTVEALQRRAFRMPLKHEPLAAAARTARSFAHKASIFTPAADMTLYGVRYFGTMPAAAITVKGSVFTVSAGLVATITLTADEYTNTDLLTSSPVLDLLFASPVSLTAGQAYGLGAGYSSSAGSVTTTTDFPIFIIPRPYFAMQLPRSGTMGSSVYHIASFVPTVGTAVTTSANDQNAGASTYSVTPIFDWA